jgi:chaperone protein EcpD
MVYFFEIQALRYQNCIKLMGLVLIFFSVALYCIPAMAELVIERTRVIYPQSQRDVVFGVFNQSANDTSYAQLWIDDGDPSADPETVATPFVLSPPLIRVAAKSRQTIRLTFTGEQHEPGHESLYWLNMLELPPKYTGPSDADRVSITKTTRI